MFTLFSFFGPLVMCVQNRAPLRPPSKEPFLPPANEVCEGYVFTGVCPQGGLWWGGCGRGACMAGRCVWQGGMHGRGHAWQGGMNGWAHAWQGGMRGRGACMAGGVHGGGHIWQGGMHAGGMHGRGHAWQGVCMADTMRYGQ